MNNAVDNDVYAALERVDFQTKSPLAQKLILAVRDAMNLVESSVGKIAPGTSADTLTLRTAASVLEKSFGKAFATICLKELNLHARVSMDASPAFFNGACYLLFKPYLEAGAVDSTQKGRALLSGLTNTTVGESPDKSYDPAYFKKIETNLDLTTSKFKKPSGDVGTVICLYAAMFIPGAVVPVDKLKPITAEEIVALILHELGHAMTLVEHMGDIYHRADVAQNTIKYISESGDVQCLNSAVADLEQHVSQDSNLPRAIAAVKPAIKGPGGIIGSIVAVLWFMFKAIDVVSPALKRIDLNSYGDFSLGGGKTSDTVVTAGNQSYMERMADEFVSRHGMGEYLVDILARNNTFYASGHTKDTFMEGIRGQNTAMVAVICLATVASLMAPAYDEKIRIYDEDWLRLEHLMRNNMVVFKDDNLDPEVRAYFVAQTKVILETIAKYKNRDTFKIKRLVWGSIFRILGSFSLKDAFTTANLSHDYDTLQLFTNGLIKNKLLYHSSRLSGLINK